jgi:hypothetical protein
MQHRAALRGQRIVLQRHGRQLRRGKAVQLGLADLEYLPPALAD